MSIHLRDTGIGEYPTRLMQEIILFSKEKELDFIELSATEEGHPLYKKLGFEEYQTPYATMRFNL